MSFRIKTILGVALIEGVLLAFLVWSGVNYLTHASENGLVLRGGIVADSMANLSRDAILTTDLDLLDGVAQRAVESPEIIYARIWGADRVLSEAGLGTALAKPFVSDKTINNVEDEIYDIGLDIREGEYLIGRVEIGVGVTSVRDLVSEAVRHLSAISAIGMTAVAIFGYILGTYLTRGLADLSRASLAIGRGELGLRVDVKGKDELAQVCNAFNVMSERLIESQREMQLSVHYATSLNHLLAEKEQRLSTILDTAVDAFITIDHDGIIDDINTAGCTLFGYELNDLVGQNVSMLMPKTGALLLESYLQQCMQAGASRITGNSHRVSGRRLNDSCFPMDLALSEMELAGKRMFVVLVRDLSTQLEAESEAYKSNLMRAAIVNASLDGLITVDAQDRIVDFNRIAEEIFILDRADVLGQCLTPLIIPKDACTEYRQWAENHLATHEDSVRGERIEVKAQRSNGQCFPSEITLHVVQVDSETFSTVLVRDIGVRKAEEQALVEAMQQAEVASNAKSRFLAHMSHEIRSPLHAVMGSLGLLLDDELSNEQRLYARTAEKSGEILLSLINDILDFSKIEAGQVVLEKKQFSVAEMVGETMDLIAFKARDKGVYTAAYIDAEARIEVQGDVVRLRQVLINLLDNALKFTESGSVLLTVEYRNRHSGECELCFAVEDTGIGIPLVAQSGLFKEFQQVDGSDSTRYGGTGLGLSICKGLVELMGGGISMSSKPSVGSRFEVCISLSLPYPERQYAVSNETVTIKRALVVGFQSQLSLEVEKALENECFDVIRIHEIDQVDMASFKDVDLLVVDGQQECEDIKVVARLAIQARVEQRTLLLPASPAPIVVDGLYSESLVSPFLLHDFASRVKIFSIDDQKQDEMVEQLAGESGQHHVRSEKILLAEDSEANRIVATAILERQGFIVDVACNGREAVEQFVLGKPDLILMDLRMPDMDGVEATAAIRALPDGDRIPIIAMTANAMQTDVDRCLSAGMDDFVHKPATRGQLLEVVSRRLTVLEPNVSNAGVDRQFLNQSFEHVELTLLDDKIVTLLGQDVPEQQFPKMMKLFVSEINERVAILSAAIDSSSLEAVEMEAHTIKSCAGTFGALRLQALANEIEQVCKAGGADKLMELRIRLHALSKETLNVYRRKYEYLKQLIE